MVPNSQMRWVMISQTWDPLILLSTVSPIPTVHLRKWDRNGTPPERREKKSTAGELNSHSIITIQSNDTIYQSRTGNPTRKVLILINFFHCQFFFLTQQNSVINLWVLPLIQKARSHHWFHWFLFLSIPIANQSITGSKQLFFLSVIKKCHFSPPSQDHL